MSDRPLLALGIDCSLPVSIAGLIDMLRYVRRTTIKAVDRLTIAQLDHRHDAESNSIGALLWHSAAVESWYQVNAFDRREWKAEEEAKWLAGVELGPTVHETVRGHPLEFYLDTLAAVRERTERELRTRDEAWLLRVEPFEETDANNYWKWFHVCEDEINHRGQIRWLRKRLPDS
jgi:uncharacterized damage-inducible protein DinB